MKSLSAALLPFLVLGFVAAGRPGPVTTPDHNFTAVSTRIVPSAQTAEGKVVQTCRTSLVIPSYESVPPTSGDRASAGRWMHRSGIRFTENRGQIADTDGRVRTDIAFVADAPGARLFCRNNGISYIFTDSHRRTSTASRDAETAMSADAASVQDAGSCRLDMILDGS
ncbi:MAG: hypothetical protein JXA28_02320, partial [Bacteroidetes bacterium]|nr:hypothetical protein [Bacteroidota bacterium]